MLENMAAKQTGDVGPWLLVELWQRDQTLDVEKPQ